MENVRKIPPKVFAGKKVIAVRDYQSSIRTCQECGKIEPITLPKSNVIYLELEDNNNFIIRPSGTEPKIKLYCLLCGRDLAEAEEIARKVKEDIKNIVG